MPKISVVMSYYNRRKQLWRTLKTIEKSKFKDIEAIIIDDASDTSQRIEDFLSEFNFIKLTRVEKKDKYYSNPCIPYNMAFSKISGDIVVIQSPECLHLGDVLTYVDNFSLKNKYLVFSCYALSKGSSDKLDEIDFDLSIDDLETHIIESIGDFRAVSTVDVGKNDSWVIHPKYRPAHYNFLSAMCVSDLHDLGGFDERFANGYAYDDTEFANRVSKKGMDIEIVRYPMCLHDFHDSYVVKDLKAKESLNKGLYERFKNNSEYKVNNSFIKRS